MLDGDYLPRKKEPYTIHITRGEFVIKSPLGDSYFSEVEGTFQKIFKCKYKGFPYWCIQLKDEMNVYNIVLPIKSACFRDLMLTLFNEKFSYLVLRPYYDGRNKLKIYVDNRLLELKQIPLPVIKRRPIDGHEHHDYSQRLHKLLEMVNEINMCNTHGRENLPTNTT
jgi:hypothetical protein